jgi:hypothetical protein
MLREVDGSYKVSSFSSLASPLQCELHGWYETGKKSTSKHLPCHFGVHKIILFIINFNVKIFVLVKQSYRFRPYVGF